jgi:hypothetical protein
MEISAGAGSQTLLEAIAVVVLAAATVPMARKRVLLWVAGVDPAHIQTVPDRARYTSMGAIVVLTATVAAASMTTALTLVFGHKWLTFLPVGLLWGAIVFSFDRWIVSSVDYGPLEAGRANCGSAQVPLHVQGRTVSSPAHHGRPRRPDHLLRRNTVVGPETAQFVAEALQALYLAWPDETLQAMFPDAPAPASPAAPAPARPATRPRPPARGGWLRAAVLTGKDTSDD